MTNAFPTRRSSDRRGGAGGRRSLATAHDQRADRLVPGTGRIGRDCGATEEGCPREPARPVDPDDARGLGRGRAVVGLDRALTEQLGAEVTLLLGGGAAAARGVRGDLTTYIAPHVTVAHGSEGTDRKSTRLNSSH